jgi:hypothetical protein
MKQHLLISIFLLLAGCSSVPERSGLSAKDVYLRSGEQGYSIRCSYSYDWPDCYKKADEVCGSSTYDVVDKFEFEAVYLGYRHNYMKRAMLARCI